MMTTKTKLAYNEDLQDVLVRSNRCLKSLTRGRLEGQERLVDGKGRMANLPEASANAMLTQSMCCTSLQM